MGVQLCPLNGGWNKNPCRPLYQNSMVKSPTWKIQLVSLVRSDATARYRLPSSLSRCLSIPAGGRRFSITLPLLCSAFTFEFVFPPAHLAVLFICLQLPSSPSLSDFAFISCSLSDMHTHGFMVKMQYSFVFTIRWAGCEGCGNEDLI